METSLVQTVGGLGTATKRIWFLNTLVCVQSEISEGISVLEHHAPFGDSQPLRVHHREDEMFIVLEGELRIRVGNETGQYGPGEVLLAPKGTPHTYRVDSSAGGRWVTVTALGDFERFVRAVGREAERDELPLPMGPPPPEAIEQLGSLASKFGIELVGGLLD